MNDIFYVRNEKNFSDLQSKARGAQDDDEATDSQRARIASPLTGSLD